METNYTIENWIETLKEEVGSSLTFSMDNSTNLKILEEDIIKLSSSLLNGQKFPVASIDENTTIAQFKKNNSDKQFIFTNKSSSEMNHLLDELIKNQSESYDNKSSVNTFLTCGLLRYSLNPLSGAFLTAPLVFIPIRLSLEEGTYYIEGIKDEFFLNRPLIEKIYKEKKLSLDYPTKLNFNVGEYLYFLSVKVKPLNWSVVYDHTLINLDLFKYYDLEEINAKKEIIAKQNIINKITYFNSEFLPNFYKSEDPLDTKFLSFLDINNDELNILRKVTNREPLYIRTKNEFDRNHIITNTIHSYLLNNRKILVAYSSNQEHASLVETLKNSSLNNNFVDLGVGEENKQVLLSNIFNYDNYKISFNNHRSKEITKTVEDYYKRKNNIKLLINGLRKSNNQLDLSINKAFENYYKLNSYNDLDIKIKNASKFNKESLNEQMNIVSMFSKASIDLGMKYENHPFYGLNKNHLEKNDYLELKKSSNELATAVDVIIKLIDKGVKDYHYPPVNNLKELKAFLNIINFVRTYKHNIDWITNDNLDQIYDELVLLKQEIARLNIVHDELVNNYTRNVDFISTSLLNEYFSTDQNISSKAKVKLMDLLGSKKEEFDIEIQLINSYHIDLEKAKIESKKYDEGMISFLKKDNLKGLRSVFNKINDFKNNLKYIKFKGDFDYKNHFEQFNVNKQLHYKSLQSYFNVILENSNIFQDYFNKEVIDVTEDTFEVVLKKVSSIAYNFPLINQYTDYYYALYSCNKLIKGLGDELVLKGEPNDFLNMYLKKFYKEYATRLMKNNEIFSSLINNKLFDELFNFDASDEARKEIITEVIDNNIAEYLKKHMLDLKKDEKDLSLHQIKSSSNLPRIVDFVEDYPRTLFLTKPCVLAPISQISYLLKESEFDGIIYLTNDLVTIKDVLPSITKAPHIMVFDLDTIIDENSILLKNKSLPNDSFNKSAAKYFENVTCVFETPLDPLSGNSFDKNLKENVAQKLKSHNVEVTLNKLVDSNIIDIVARLKNTKNEIAIIVDHLSYSSPEQAFKTVNAENEILKDLGYIPYRLISASYFYNEEIEFEHLLNYIVKNSKIIPSYNTKKKQIKLMDYLFPKFEDPHLVYYQINNDTVSLKDKIYDLITKCAPISIKELDLVVEENTSITIDELVKEEKIIVEDNFIYLKGKSVVFRVCNRDEEFYRPLEYISDKELFNGIYYVIKNQQQIELDKLIKMILLSLGYKKTNESLNNYIYSRIQILVDSNLIIKDENNNLIFKKEND